MGVVQPPELLLPRPPRWPPWAVATSIVLHVAAVVVLVLMFAPGPRRAAHHLLGSLPTESRTQRRDVLVALLPLHPPTPPAPAVRSPRAPAPAVLADDRVRVSPTPVGQVPSDSAPAWAVPDRHVVESWRSLGTGQLWDRRPPTAAGVPRTHAELTDSAVKAIINNYLDSLAALPGGGRVLPPSWKATIGGREYGLDGQWITVAGVKIPSLILALIPFPNGGNESKALDVQGRMRAQDYQLALPRAAAAADQREQIKEIRAREEAERDFTRQQEGAGEAP